MVVTIYSTPTCPHCKAAKEYFKDNNIDYEEFNVAQDSNKSQEMMELSGQRGVPVIVIGDYVIVGFDKEAVKKALAEQK